MLSHALQDATVAGHAPRKNILYKRYGFWNLHQEDKEPIDAYLMQIKIKIDMCEYAKEGWPLAVREEMTCDNFVFGLTDDNLKERLLRTNCPTNVSAIQQNKQISSLQGVIQCKQCGRQHKPRECPVYSQHCSYCHKLNHFA